MTLHAKVSPCIIFCQCKNVPLLKKFFVQFCPASGIFYQLAILSARANLNSTHFRVLINKATFVFLAKKVLTFSKQHKNTLCKTSDYLEKLLPWQHSIFLKTTPMQTVQYPKNLNLEFLARNFLTCSNYHKNTPAYYLKVLRKHILIKKSWKFK